MNSRLVGTSHTQESRVSSHLVKISEMHPPGNCFSTQAVINFGPSPLLT